LVVVVVPPRQSGDNSADHFKYLRSVCWSMLLPLLPLQRATEHGSNSQAILQRTPLSICVATVGAMPPGGMSHSSGDPGRLMKAASFTSRVRQAGVSVAARDNTHLRGNFARGLVTHLHADTAIIAHMPSNVSKLQWKVWQFFEDPNSSKAVRHLLPLSWRCARWPTPPRLQRACTPSPPVRLRRSISPSS
jgi:hypothetical protein